MHFVRRGGKNRGGLDAAARAEAACLDRAPAALGWDSRSLACTNVGVCQRELIVWPSQKLGLVLDAWHAYACQWDSRLL